MEYHQQASFYYETHDYSYLMNQYFRITLDSTDTTTKNTVIEIPISTLALLPSLHQIDIQFPTIEQKMTLQYNVEMNQVSEITFRIQRLQLHLLNPLECYLRCTFDDGFVLQIFQILFLSFIVEEEHASVLKLKNLLEI